MHLLLHIGPHKTGTTYIQQSLFRSIELMEARDWCYPRTGRPWPHHAHHDIPYRFEAMRQSGKLQELKAEARGFGNVILSAEGFCNLDNEALTALADLFEAERVTLVYYLRDPYSQFRSYWQERVKQGHLASLPEWFMECFRDPASHYVVNPLVHLDRYRQLDQRFSLRLYSYDRMVSGKINIMDPIWYETMGMDVPFNTHVDRPNVSLSVEVVEYLRVMIERYLEKYPAVDGRSVRQAFYRPFIDKWQGRPDNKIERAHETMIRHLGREPETMVLHRGGAFYDFVESELNGRYGTALCEADRRAEIFPRGEVVLKYFEKSDILSQAEIVDVMDEMIEKIRNSGRVVEFVDSATL